MTSMDCRSLIYGNLYLINGNKKELFMPIYWNKSAYNKGVLITFVVFDAQHNYVSIKECYADNIECLTPYQGKLTISNEQEKRNEATTNSRYDWTNICKSIQK